MSRGSHWGSDVRTKDTKHTILFHPQCWVPPWQLPLRASLSYIHTPCSAWSHDHVTKVMMSLSIVNYDFCQELLP